MARSSRHDRADPIADVAVVGGGIIGSAVAHELAKRGRSVVVLERHPPGGGATGAAGGFLSAATKQSGPHLDLARASLAMYRTLESELDAGPIGYRRSGCLILAESGDDLPTLGELMIARRDRGLSLVGLSVPEALALEPGLSPEIAGAALCPDDAEAAPMAVLTAYRTAAERYGARFRSEAPLLGASHRNGDWRLEIPCASLTCRQVVLAAGAWTGLVGRRFHVELPIQPRRGQALLMQVQERLIRHPMLSAGYFRAKLDPAEPEASVELSLWQRPDGIVFAGGTREWAGFSTMPDDRLLAELRRRAEAALPALARVAAERVLGFRPYSDTGLPMLGPIPGRPGLFIAAGHEGDGISLAPVTGRLLAQCMTGEPLDADLAPFRPPARAHARRALP